MAPKSRHIPPFPFKNVAKVDSSSLCLMNGSGRSVDVWSSSTFTQLLQIQKKGDFNTTCFDKLANFIVYSDCKDTQVFSFDQATLQL